MAYRIKEKPGRRHLVTTSSKYHSPKCRKGIRIYVCIMARGVELLLWRGGTAFTLPFQGRMAPVRCTGAELCCFALGQGPFSFCKIAKKSINLPPFFSFTLEAISSLACCVAHSSSLQLRAAFVVRYAWRSRVDIIPDRSCSYTPTIVWPTLLKLRSGL